MNRWLQILTFMLGGVLLFGCEDKPSSHPPAPAPVLATPSAVLFKDPIGPELTELPTEALALWRSADGRPTPLVLLSKHPFLSPVPAELRERAIALAQGGDRQTLKKHGSINRLDPVILTQQALSAAIEAGLIERIVWFFPFQEPLDQLDLESFRNQITAANFLTPEEAARLTLENGVFTGTVRKIPLNIVHPKAIRSNDSAVLSFASPPVVHFDLSYLRGLYVDSVKTAPYDMLRETIAMLDVFNLRPRAAVFTPRTEEGEISLDARFLIHDVMQVVENPAMMDAPMPEVWKQRAEALQLKTMLQREDAAKLIVKAAQDHPRDPGVLYDLMNLRMKNDQLDEARKILDTIVALEPGYVYSYLEMATFFVNNQRFERVEPLLLKAAGYYPDNPFIRINLAQLYLQRNQPEKARPLIDQLRALDWSPHYHAPAQPGLDALAEQLIHPQ